MARPVIVFASLLILFAFLLAALPAESAPTPGDSGAPPDRVPVQVSREASYVPPALRSTHRLAQPLRPDLEPAELARLVFPGARVEAPSTFEQPLFDAIDPSARRKLSRELLLSISLAEQRAAGTPIDRWLDLEPRIPFEDVITSIDRSPPGMRWPAAGLARSRQDRLRVIVQTRDLEAARRAGLVVRARTGDIVSGLVRVADLVTLARLPSVQRIEAPSVRQTNNDLARLDASVEEVQAEWGLTGSFVAVAAIDTGLDFTHPSFRNPNGSTRVRRLLDLAYPGDVDADGELDGPVAGGTEYSEHQINQALAFGNGEVFRSDWPELIELPATGYFLDLDSTERVETLDVQIHLEHPWLAALELAIVDPDEQIYAVPSLVEATQSALQATYRIPFPPGASAAGEWSLVVLDPTPYTGVLLQWSLHLNRIVYQEDLGGHGTHVVGSAAGNGLTLQQEPGPFVGMAPEADILFVRGERSLGGFGTDDIISGMAWVDETADALGLPYVLNMSLGGHGGPHDGTDLEELALDQLVGPDRQGRVIVTSAGNEGGRNMHAQGWLEPGNSQIPFLIEGEGIDRTNVALYLDGGGNPSIGLDWPFPETLRCQTLVVADGELVDPRPDCARIQRLTVGGPLIVFQLHDADGAMINSGGMLLTDTGKAIELFVQWAAEELPVLAWSWDLEVSGFEGRWDAWQPGCAPLVACDDSMTIGIPATANHTIAVGAHTTREAWLDSQGNPRVGDGLMDDIAPFSSRGPSRDGRAKPDLTAPGNKIISTLSSSFLPCPYVSRAACIDAGIMDRVLGDVVSLDHGLLALEGTSMAAPMVTGAVALLLEADPGLDAIAVRDLLQWGAREDLFTGSPPDPDVWGAGKLDLYPIFDDGSGSGSWSEVEVAGLRFYAETPDLYFPRQPIGYGSYENPIVLYEAITGPDPVIRIEGFELIDNRAGHDPVTEDPISRIPSFWLKKVVLNETDEECQWFDHELQSVPGEPSGNDDGLSFAQGDEALRPWTSNRFARVIEQTEARDFINFSLGSLPTLESGFFRYAITRVYTRPPADPAPPAAPQQADVPIWLVQTCNRIPVTPEPPPTVTPRPTRTPRPQVPGRVYLPVTIEDPDCPPKDQFVDVAIVIDASTSMLERVPDGRRKWELAVDAARQFVYGMRLNGSGKSDQIALVTFNATGETLHPLTPHRHELLDALDRFSAIQATSRLELGVLEGTYNLTEPNRRRKENRMVMVVVSDGQANPVPGRVAVRAAATAKATGITMYVLGIGPTLDESVLLDMASDAERYFFVPSAAELRGVMVDLAATKIPCAREIYWPFK